jgi:hypothetical protein
MFMPLLTKHSIAKWNAHSTGEAVLAIPWRHLLLRVSLLVVIGFFLILLPPAVLSRAAAGPDRTDRSVLESQWGVQIVGIRQSAAGHMLDFRYRVTDADKAAPLFVRQTKPYLIDQASGKSLVVPNMAKVGPLRSSNRPQQGRTYWMFFGNPGLVKAGSKITVVIGDFKVEDLTVQ